MVIENDVIPNSIVFGYDLISTMLSGHKRLSVCKLEVVFYLQKQKQRNASTNDAESIAFFFQNRKFAFLYTSIVSSLQ